MARLWDHREDESADAFRAFRAYCECPPGPHAQTVNIPRAMRYIGFEPTPSATTTWRRWKKRHQWEARRRAREAYFAEQTDAAIERNRRSATSIRLYTGQERGR